MKKSIIFGMILAIVASMSASATIINVPEDYETIQEGIDASSDGDTVLVQPGTYVENINFNGHNIVLGSMFLMTGDTSYISQTIIDGNSVTAVIFVSGEDSTTALKAFTVQNGFSIEEGGGIICRNSSPLIAYNTIRNNRALG